VDVYTTSTVTKYQAPYVATDVDTTGAIPTVVVPSLVSDVSHRVDVDRYDTVPPCTVVESSFLFSLENL
jgi:hypothetical protein